MMGKAPQRLSELHSSHRQALLASIVESSEDAIISKDLNGMIMSWNQSSQRILGYSESEVIGKHISIIIPESRLEEEDIITASILRGDKISNFNTIRKTRKGEEIDVSLTISPMYDSENRIIGASKILRDISVQIEMKNKMMESNLALQQANIYKDEFIGILAHELRTPLTSSKACLELALSIPERKDELLIKSKQHLDRLARMLSELLDVARLQAGRFHIHPAKVDVREFVGNAIEVIQYAYSSHKIEYTPPSAIWVEADMHRMEQVVMNLLTNAIKYSPDADKVIVSVYLVGDAVEIKVTDFGLGIPTADQDKIWTRFYRVPMHKQRVKGNFLLEFLIKG